MDSENLSKAAVTIDKARSDELLPLNFDAEEFKQSFALLLAKLEAATESTESMEEEIPQIIIEPIMKETLWSTVIKRVFSPKNVRIVGNVAAVFAAVVTTAANLKNSY